MRQPQAKAVAQPRERRFTPAPDCTTSVGENVKRASAPTGLGTLLAGAVPIDGDMPPIRLGAGTGLRLGRLIPTRPTATSSGGIAMPSRVGKLAVWEGWPLDEAISFSVQPEMTTRDVRSLRQGPVDRP